MKNFRKRVQFRDWIIFSFAIATAAHFVRADVKFLFPAHAGHEFVKVALIEGDTAKFKFLKCHGESSCGVIGSKEGYTVEDIRIPIFKLTDRRDSGELTTQESHDLEILQEIIDGIEQPRPMAPRPGYSYAFKITPDQFVKVMERRLTLEESMNSSNSGGSGSTAATKKE